MNQNQNPSQKKGIEVGEEEEEEEEEVEVVVVVKKSASNNRVARKWTRRERDGPAMGTPRW